MIESNIPTNPMSFEEASNFLNKAKKYIKKTVKKQMIENAQISVAEEGDRISYLTYVVNLLDTISYEVERAFLGITGCISSSLTQRDIANLLRKILTLRINGYRIESIAHHLKEPVEIMKKLETLGRIAVGEAIERKKLSGIPIINVNQL